MTGPPSNGDASWEIAGRRAADAVAGCDALVVIADDPDAGAEVVRGIAAERVAEQRVIIGDLIGGVPALRELQSDDDPHGIAESFEHGVSLARVAHPTSIDRLEVMPSGDGPVELEAIVRSGRWSRMAHSCRENRTLLLLLARSTAPGLAELVGRLDGAIVVGHVSLDPVPPFLVRQRIRHPVPDRKAVPAEAEPVAPARRWPIAAAAVGVVLIAGIAGGVVAWRAYLSSLERARPRQAAAARIIVPAAPGPAAPDALLPANPGDSAAAAAFGIELLSANTPEGAKLELRRRATLPAATISPVPVGAGGATWYKVIVGAFAEQRQADSLLRAARARGVISGSAGVVVRVPLALLLESVPSRGRAGSAVRRYANREVAAYPLLQSDGRVLLYAGAFVHGGESASLATELRAAGLNPTLVYRTGRSF